MKPLRLATSLASTLCSAALLTSAFAEVAYVEPTLPFKNSAFLQGLNPAKVDVGRGTLNIPIITWAADGVTVHANNGMAPAPQSALAKATGVPVKLELVDDFEKQIANYVSGKSPFLRGTMGMINLASEALAEKGDDLKPVVILQLSWSTGADGFVAKNIKSLADLKGKSIVVQQAGPHVDLIQTLLEDAGLKPGDVTIKYVRDITYNPDNKGGSSDPANALREDPTLAGAACIFPDILALTAGGNVGTGAEDSVKGARPVLSTRTASRVIADVYAVRADFLRENREIVHGFVLEHLRAQARFDAEVANVSKKKAGDKAQVEAFKKSCRPLAGIFLQDEEAVADYIAWVGLDLDLAGYNGNLDFFGNTKNPVGFAALSNRIQNFYAATGTVSQKVLPAHANWNYQGEIAGFLNKSGAPVVAAAPKEKAFSSTQAVRQAADSDDASELFNTTFKFPPNTSEIKWQNHKEIFDTLHEKVTRYGGAVVQLRGHADNFFYNFVQMKKKQGDKTYKKRVPGTNQFKEFELPALEQVVNSANRLSYERAFSVKRAYAQYLRENLGYTPDEIDLSRFDVKGMGVSDPIHKKPTDAKDRGENMRGQMVIFAVEAEIPLEFDIGDLQ